jgi:hypothetical protein
MSSMNDPMSTLVKFQRAIEMGFLTLLPGELHPDISMTVDQPNGTYRYTYAKLDGQTVQSIVFFVAVRSIEGFGRLQVSVATAEGLRGRGLATETLAKGIDELRHALAKQGPDTFWLDAVVPNANEPAVRLAQKLIADTSMRFKDPDTGEPAGLYRRMVE